MNKDQIMNKEENDYGLLLNEDKEESQSSTTNEREREEKITDRDSEKGGSEEVQSVRSDGSYKSRKSYESKKRDKENQKKKYKTEVQVRKEKKYMLQKLNNLRQDYPTVRDKDPTEYNINSSYEQLEEGLQDAVDEKEFQDQRDYYRCVIVFGTQGIERLNNMFGRGGLKLNLDGFSQNTHDEIFIYDPELREIHEKYGGYTAKTPVELRLIIKMIRSAFAYSATKQTLQNTYPQVNAEQLMRDNPELAAKVEEKVFEQMEKRSSIQSPIRKERMYEANKYQQPQMEDLKIEKEMNDILNQVDMQAKNLNKMKVTSPISKSIISETPRSNNSQTATLLTRDSVGKKKRGRKSKAQKELEKQQQEQEIIRSPSQQSSRTSPEGGPSY